MIMFKWEKVPDDDPESVGFKDVLNDDNTDDDEDDSDVLDEPLCKSDNAAGPSSSSL